VRPGIKPTIVLLAVLGIGDLLAVPFLIAAHHRNPAQPPVPAIVAIAIFGLATLASAAGLARGRRWPVPVALTCRVLDSVSSLLGLVAHPNAVLDTWAAATLVLSVMAVVLLLRLYPRKSAQPSPGAAAQLGNER
jgi:hypothetical protein